MPISPKTITVFLDPTPSGKKRAAQAVVLAQRWDAHLVGVDVVFAGVELPSSMAYARGGKAIANVIAYERRLESNAEAVAAEVREHFRALCAEHSVSGEFRRITRERSSRAAIRLTFHSDLVVVGHPEPDGLPDGLSLDELLLASGVPLLIVPNAWEDKAIGNKVLIGWNATREARRAVLDSLAFLTAARSVIVLAIDQKRSRQHDDGPDCDIAVNLERHGVHADLEQVESRGFSIPVVLLSYAEQSASDLLVVGAYSHARLREALLGGTTRTLLAHTPMPTLMSR